MKCIKCGHEVNEKEEKCSICETAVEYSTKYYHIQYENAHSKKGTGKLLFGIFIILILGALIFITVQTKKPEKKGNENPKLDTIDSTKRNLVEMNTRYFVNAVETYAVYSMMDEKEMSAGIYSVKDEDVKTLLQQMQIRSEMPIDGWFVLNENRFIVAAELQFKSYSKIVGYTANSSAKAVLKQVSNLPSSIEEAISIVQTDLEQAELKKDKSS